MNGGTSASTPLWAGLVARLSEKLGRRVGWLNETIYHPDLQAAFQSVRTGDNKVVDTEAAFFTAHEGWNACCGLGVPTGNSLLACLQKSGERQ